VIKSEEAAGHAVGPPRPIHYSGYTLFKNFPNCKEKMCWSTVMYEPSMNPSLQMHILQQIWKDDS